MSWFGVWVDESEVAVSIPVSPSEGWADTGDAMTIMEKNTTSMLIDFVEELRL